MDFIRYLLKKTYKIFKYCSSSILISFLIYNIPLHADERQETVTLQLKWFHQFQFAGYYAAKEKGFYAEEGLNVLLKERGPLKSNVQAVLDGEAEYGVADASLLIERIQDNPVILLKQIFQHSPLVFISQKDSEIISPYEMIGEKVMFDPSEDSPLAALLLDTIGALDRIRTKYDKWIWLHDRAIMAFEENNTKYAYGVFSDITEHKRAKEAEEEKERLSDLLQQAQKMEAIGTLAGGIAHDFNNILSSIFGFAELAKMRAAKGKSIEKYLDEVLSAGIRAKDLVQHILAFSRQADIQKGSIAVLPLIKETLKFIRASIPTTIEIRYDLGDIDYKVLADPTQIHQILMNLCTNAAHAMIDKGGLLDLRLKEIEISDENSLQYNELNNGRYLQLTIADTGHGIEKDLLDRIFDPFFTTKERGEGTGLGLSVVHGIVKDLEGAIFVYSKLGRGTTFEVLLPLHEGETTYSEPQQGPIKKGKGRILYVDDEEAIVQSGEEILEKLGYDVVSTTSSVEALEIFKSRLDEFDLVLTDLTMPKMTGVEMSSQIIKIRPDIPILLCTGFSEGITPERTKDAGICELIMKPTIARELAEAVNNAINLKPNRK